MPIKKAPKTDTVAQFAAIPTYIERGNNNDSSESVAQDKTEFCKNICSHNNKETMEKRVRSLPVLQECR